MKQKNKFYAVAKGSQTGIFTKWFGPGGAEEQIRGFNGARYKGFPNKEEALQWMESPESNSPIKKNSASSKTPKSKNEIEAALKEGKVVMYTDGSSLNNPGPGGYGAVLLNNSKRKEIWAGYRLTTNNRMELTACIEGLKILKKPCSVLLFSDSQYVVNGIQKGWAKRWKSKNWMRTKTEKAENADLWAQLLDLCDTHDVEFNWVKGHAGNPENERCDQLANKGSADQDHFLIDTFYEENRK